MKKVFLNNNWQFRESGKTEWEKASIPGNIHLDLLTHGKIPDPYYRDNETKQQWIGETDWEYITVFETDSEIKISKNIDLVFEGLDTYADVYLNGNLVLQSDNMYHGWRVDIKPYIVPGSNELKIYFHSIVKKTLHLFENNGFEYGANNSQPEPKLSVYTRKPGYHFGWDWGPRLLTCGIWRPVYIELWEEVRFDNVRFVQKKLSGNLANLQLEIELLSSTDTEIKIELSNKQSTFNTLSRNYEVHPGFNKLIFDFEIKDPQRWWCNGLGEPYLYDLKLELFNDNNLSDSWSSRVGLRTLELIHTEDSYGKNFYFRLNDIPVFIKGANCIPVDYFIPRIKEEQYRKLIKDAADSNMNMLRLWGGAVYEEQRFYDLCDELGIMVWQDFMFACAMYPADEDMTRRIKAEAEYNIKRIRNHTCLALWCGNNEIDEGWHTWGWQQRYNYSEEICNKIWDNYCTIFHEILPDAVNEFDPERAYWPSSPKYGFVDERSKTDGDMHYWGVWFLNHPREKFKEHLPRFMSEYGLQSMPEIKTFKSFSLPEDWDLKSAVMLAHQRQYPNPKKNQFLGGYDMMLKYLETEFHIPTDFELLLYVSQILQADYLKYAIETHRRNMPYCMGTMYWQLNDLWPVTSWSTIDYYGRWKAAHYAVKKAYSNLLTSIDSEGEKIKIFVINDSADIIRASLNIQLMDFEGKVYFEKTCSIKTSPFSSKSYFEIDKKVLLSRKDPDTIFLYVLLINDDGLLSENFFYFNYTKNLKLKEPHISYSIQENREDYSIKIKSKKLAKNVKIDIPYSDGSLSDNYFDLLPGRDKIVKFKPEDDWNKKINVVHYYMVQKLKE